MDGKPTRGTFIENLLRQGIDHDFAEKMAALAEENGQLAPADGTDDIDILSPPRRSEAEHEAVDIAMALAETRTPTVSLAAIPRQSKRSWQTGTPTTTRGTDTMPGSAKWTWSSASRY